MNNGIVSINGVDSDIVNQFRYIVWGTEGFGTTKEECKAKLKELYEAGTPLTVVGPYAKAFINTHSISPQTIRALRGINNVFSDANGDVELTYWTH